MKFERPLDFLGNKVGKDILFKMKDNNNLLIGRLMAVDLNINLVVEIKGKLVFYKGEQIIWIE